MGTHLGLGQERHWKAGPTVNTAPISWPVDQVWFLNVFCLNHTMFF